MPNIYIRTCLPSPIYLDVLESYIHERLQVMNGQMCVDTIIVYINIRTTNFVPIRWFLSPMRLHSGDIAEESSVYPIIS
jgi:hypothetical protein